MKLLFAFLVFLNFTAFSVEKPSYSVKEYHKKHHRGLRRDKNKLKEFKKKHHKRLKHAEISIVPGSFDLTGRVSRPLNQGQCGSCWDFSITKSFWSEFMLNGYSMPQPAVNYLLNNCSGVANARELGCNGGDFPAGEGMLSPAKGPWAESQDPYTESGGRCKSGLLSLGVAVDWNIVGDENHAPTFQELAVANYNGGHGHVLSVDVAAGGGNWMNYSGGIYNRNGGCSIDHMIDLIGYNCESSVDAAGNCVFNSKGQPVNGDGYLKVQNNWGDGSDGSNWGEDGYMRTRWGMNCIAETAFAFEVTPLSPSPSPTPTVSPTPSPSPTPTPSPSPTPVSCHGFLCGKLTCWLPWCHRD